MKASLLMPFLLLVTASALHLENDAPRLESLEMEADWDQDLDGSGEQEEELALTEEGIQSTGEDDQDAVESDTAVSDEDLQCPREEDTVEMQGGPGCKTCHFRLVKSPKNFQKAEKICKKCYKGNLVSIHSYSSNKRILSLASAVNRGQVWIGGIRKCWFLLFKKFYWTDGSCWNFTFWAPGEPGNGHGNCVSLCTGDGRWRRIQCNRRRPFICSY
ncbi:proteoglycan 3 isoform X1 [Oryctolagus cuniculus]|uniref:proteoglycan 3 isoform X1 n=1 Tax=Oryctolagus cuniculus TaxID=9986 RepID=UPI0001C64696|nr:proteoglycan 3 isoform X1 [Oryctolagus cuniculus]